MSSTIEHCLNKASAPEIAEHLRACDDEFVPPLSGRVEINDYAIKIANSATRFEAWADGELIGLVAAYCNNEEDRVAYITSVSVRTKWTGSGIAARLLEQCILYLKSVRFDHIELEVNGANARAIRLYAKMGFVRFEAQSKVLVLRLNPKREA